VRRRILLTILLVTAGAVGAFFVPAMLAVRSRIQRSDLLELQREASTVATRIGDGPVELAAMDALLDRGHELGVYDVGGRLVAGVGPDRADAVVDVALAGESAEGSIDGNLVAAAPVAPGPAGPELAVRISEPMSESAARVRRSALLLALAALGVLMIAGVVGALLARRLSRPLERLRHRAATIGREDAGPAPAHTGIGEIDEHGDALTDAGMRIQELLRRERSFSSHVSHQLRTPVAAMRVAIETELAAPRQDPTEVLAESLRALERLESTIESMLALARHDERLPAWCDVGELVRDHAERWRPSYAAAGRDVTVDAPVHPAEVDAAAVGHILDVVLENALVHGRGPVAVTVRRQHGSIDIDIADEGPSDAAADPFADGRVDTSHGIGLRLARTLAESEGGQLRLVEVAPTVFRLSLPVPARESRF
jgi:signal transduction histidine kinase